MGGRRDGQHEFHTASGDVDAWIENLASLDGELPASEESCECCGGSCLEVESAQQGGVGCGCEHVHEHVACDG